MELGAAAAVYTSFPRKYFEEREVVHFIDNVGALAGLIKGSSASLDGLAIIRAFHVANLALRASVWFSYVASKANVADLPSRGDLATMASHLAALDPAFSLSGDRVGLVLPVCHPDPSSLWEAALEQLGLEPPPPEATSLPPRRQRSRKRQRCR